MPEPQSKTCLVAFGTRPEAIKLAPVIQALRASTDLRPRVLVTAQHRELLDQVLDVFGIEPDVDLDLMRPGQSLTETTVGVLEGVGRAIDADRPDMLLVQGDTTSTFAAALAAFYRQVPIGHVEAGLRSGRLDDPYPEEANRLLVSRLAALHFAPTARAQQALLAEATPSERVLVTGNTVVDALRFMLAGGKVPGQLPDWPASGRAILVTLHRRESWGPRLADVCQAFLDVLDAEPDASIVFPVHPQPRVRETVYPLLGSHDRVRLIEPLDYLEFVAAMRACDFIVTDSGGIQEEAPVLAKPVLVLRQVTERPEAIEAGTSRLVGTDRVAVVAAMTELLRQPDVYDRMAHAASPFGDGHAAERIVSAIRSFLSA